MEPKKAKKEEDKQIKEEKEVKVEVKEEEDEEDFWAQFESVEPKRKSGKELLEQVDEEIHNEQSQTIITTTTTTTTSQEPTLPPTTTTTTTTTPPPPPSPPPPGDKVRREVSLFRYVKFFPLWRSYVLSHWRRIRSDALMYRKRRVRRDDLRGGEVMSGGGNHCGFGKKEKEKENGELYYFGWFSFSI